MRQDAAIRSKSGSKRSRSVHIRKITQQLACAHHTRLANTDVSVHKAQVERLTLLKSIRELTEMIRKCRSSLPSGWVKAKICPIRVYRNTNVQQLRELIDSSRDRLKTMADLSRLKASIARSVIEFNTFAQKNRHLATHQALRVEDVLLASKSPSDAFLVVQHATERVQTSIERVSLAHRLNWLVPERLRIDTTWAPDATNDTDMKRLSARVGVLSSAFAWVTSFETRMKNDPILVQQIAIPRKTRIVLFADIGRLAHDYWEHPITCTESEMTRHFDSISKRTCR